MRLAEIFVKARPRLEAALEYSGGEFDIDDIWRLVASEEGQLWHSDDFSGITEVIHYPQKTVVLVHLAGGNLEALQNMTRPGGDLERFAKLVGADAIEIQGRRGWVRALADHGYREKAVRVFKELQDE